MENSYPGCKDITEVAHNSSHKIRAVNEEKEEYTQDIQIRVSATNTKIYLYMIFCNILGK